MAEIQRAHRLLRPGARVIDLGCWPGGWLQVASQAVGPSGRVVGADRKAIDPPLDLANVVALELDLTQPGAAAAILETLGGLAEVVLCDAAPKLTGIRATDRANEEALLGEVCALIPKLLRPGGNVLVKVLDGPEADEAVRRLDPLFDKAKTVRPEASRKGTSERYLLGWGYKGRT